MPSGSNLVMQFNEPAGITGIIYGAEYSSDLVNWFPATDSGSGGTHIFSVPIGSNTKLFMRAVVTNPSP